MLVIPRRAIAAAGTIARRAAVGALVAAMAVLVVAIGTIAAT